MSLLAEGPNFRIETDESEGHVVNCRIWRRPDLDSETGAQCAETLAGTLRRLPTDRPGVTRLVIDFREAPTVTGPKTEAALGTLMNAWERAGKPVAIMVNEGVQRLQLARVLHVNAPRHGTIVGQDSSKIPASPRRTS